MPRRPTDPHRTLRWASFARGEAGAVNPAKAPAGSVTALDAVVYASGDIGPRCGLGEITAAGGAVGELNGLGFYSLASGVTLPPSWFSVGTQVFTNVASPVLLTGALASVPTKMLAAVPIGQTVYATSYGDKLYKWTTAAVSAVAASPGGLCACLYGDRLLVANTNGAGGSGAGGLTTNRVFYSAANNFDSWPGTNYFDVGRGASIVGMWAVRTVVYIVLDDGSWWLYSGVPGSTDVLRLAYTGASAPDGPQAGAVIGGQSVYFVARGEHFPSWFNGSSVQVVDEQSLEGRLYGAPAFGKLPGVTVIPVSRSGDILVLAGAGLTGSSRRTLLLREGRWSRHTLWPSVAVPVPGGGGLVLLSDGGAAGAAPRFFYWQATGYDRPPDGSLNRPILDASVGPVSADITFPELVADAGMATRVQAVRVEGRLYDTVTPPASLRLPGIVGNFASTPNNPAFASITGDVFLRIRCSMDDWTPTATTGLIGCTTGAASSGYGLRLSGANLVEFVWIDAGGATRTLTCPTPPPVTDGAVLWIAVNFDADNGAGAASAAFFTSAAPTNDFAKVNWTLLGTVTTAPATTIKPSTLPLAVGARPDGNSWLMIGNVYAAVVYNPAGAGSLIANPIFAEQPPGTTSFVDAAGLVWQVSQTGALIAQIKSDATAEQREPRFGFNAEVYATRRAQSEGSIMDIDDAPAAVHPARFTSDAGATDGRPMRWMLGVGDQGPGGGFKVRLADVRGVAIEQVEVDYLEEAKVP